MPQQRGHIEHVHLRAGCAAGAVQDRPVIDPRPGLLADQRQRLQQRLFGLRVRGGDHQIRRAVLRNEQTLQLAFGLRGLIRRPLVLRDQRIDPVVEMPADLVLFLLDGPRGCHHLLRRLPVLLVDSLHLCDALLDRAPMLARRAQPLDDLTQVAQRLLGGVAPGPHERAPHLLRIGHQPFEELRLLLQRRGVDLLRQLLLVVSRVHPLLIHR